MPFSTSSNGTDKLPHPNEKWNRYCSLQHTIPLIAAYAVSNEPLLEMFKASPQYCCGLNLTLGNNANYAEWLFSPCQQLSPTIPHSVRVFEFVLNLRGAPLRA